MILLALFFQFLKIGAFTFGGGYAMIPLIEQTVTAEGWLSKQEIIDFVGVSESTPGPFAVNIATYIGWRTGGTPGAAVSTFGVVLPAFLVMLVISGCYAGLKRNRYVADGFGAVRAAVVGLIGAALVSVSGNVFHLAARWLGALHGTGAALNGKTAREDLISLVIVAVSGVLAWKKLHPILIICVSAALGIVLGTAAGV